MKRYVKTKKKGRELLFSLSDSEYKFDGRRGFCGLFPVSDNTGKAMAAEIPPSNVELDHYPINLSTVVSKYIGETEKNLYSVFGAAEQSGAILFFDEADALFRKRSEVKDAHDCYANIEINDLFERAETDLGFEILTTNLKSLVDQAFLCCLSFQVEFLLTRCPISSEDLEGHCRILASVCEFRIILFSIGSWIQSLIEFYMAAGN